MRPCTEPCWPAQADKEGKAAAFAEKYRNSALCVANQEAIDAEVGYIQGKADLANSKEVAVKRATTVGSIPGFWTIVKVSVSLSKYNRALYRPVNSLC